nr:DNA-binding pseudobarrel domain-containing protein [Tanacetum cinerariifolium]
GGAVLKLVTRVKRLEGLLQQRKRRLVLSDFEGDDATSTEQDIDLEALHTLASKSLGGDSTDKAAGYGAAEVPADATMPFWRRRLMKPFTSFTSAHVPENIPAGAVVDKGKAPMVDDSLPADLLSEQERILKNLHDYQLGEDLAKKLHTEQEAEFARQQDELAQKTQAEHVASPTEHVSAATTPSVLATESRPADTPTASAHVSVEHFVVASTHSSLRRRRKHIAKRRVTPIVDIADAALIKFDSDSGSDDDPLPCLLSSQCSYFGAYAEAWVGGPEQRATGKDVSNPFMAVMVCQKPLAYFSSSMIHVPRAELVFNPPVVNSAKFVRVILGRDIHYLYNTFLLEEAHLDKDCPLNEDVKSVEEAKYGEFGRPSPFSNGAKYHVGPPGYYTLIDNRLVFGEKRPSLEELMNKHLEESMRRRAKMEEWVNKLH